MNKCGLYSVHSWKNMNMDVKPYIKGIFWDIDLLQYLSVLSLHIFSVTKTLLWNREMEATQKRPLFMKASSFGSCSEFRAMCVSVYKCIHVCKYICIYMHMCVQICSKK